MPTYDFRDPETGRTVSVTGDAPPTEADLDAIFADIKGVPPEPGLAQKLAQAVTTPLRGVRALGVGAAGLARMAVSGPGKGEDQEEWARQNLGMTGLGKVAEQAAAATRPGYEPKTPTEKVGAFASETAALAPALGALSTGGLLAQAAKGGLGTGALSAVTQAADRGDVDLIETGISGALGAAVPFIAPSLKAVARVITGTAKVAATSGSTLSRQAVDDLMENPKLMEQARGTARAVGDRARAIQQALLDEHNAAGEALDTARKAIGLQEPFSVVAKRVEKEGFKPVGIQEMLGDFKVLAKEEVPVTVIRDAKKSHRMTARPVHTGEPVIESASTLATAAEKERLPELLRETVGLRGSEKSGAAAKELSDLLGRYGMKGSKSLLNDLGGNRGAKPRLKAFRKIEQEFSIGPFKSAAEEASPEQAMEYTKILVNIPEKQIEKVVKLPAKARLRDLIRLRQNVDDLIKFSRAGTEVHPIGTKNQEFLWEFRGKINKVIAKIPGGKALRDADAKYSASRELFNELQKQIATDGGSEELIKRLAKGSSLADLIGKPGEQAQLLRQLETRRGAELIEPSRREVSAMSFRTAQPTGWTGIIPAALGPQGTVNFLLGARGLAKAPAALAEIIGSKGLQGALKAASAYSTRREKRK